MPSRRCIRRFNPAHFLERTTRAGATSTETHGPHRGYAAGVVRGAARACSSARTQWCATAGGRIYGPHNVPTTSPSPTNTRLCSRFDIEFWSGRVTEPSLEMCAAAGPTPPPAVAPAIRGLRGGARMTAGRARGDRTRLPVRRRTCLARSGCPPKREAGTAKKSLGAGTTHCGSRERCCGSPPGENRQACRPRRSEPRWLTSGALQQALSTRYGTRKRATGEPVSRVLCLHRPSFKSINDTARSTPVGDPILTSVRRAGLQHSLRRGVDWWRASAAKKSRISAPRDGYQQGLEPAPQGCAPPRIPQHPFKTERQRVRDRRSLRTCGGTDPRARRPSRGSRSAVLKIADVGLLKPRKTRPAIASTGTMPFFERKPSTKAACSWRKPVHHDAKHLPGLSVFAHAHTRVCPHGYAQIALWIIPRGGKRLPLL